MATHTIKMPDIGEGIAEVEIVEWHVDVGDVVAEDQVLADVMTDKASVEIPSPIAGSVVSLGGKVGDILAVGADLITLRQADTSDTASSDNDTAADVQGTSDIDAKPDAAAEAVAAIAVMTPEVSAPAPSTTESTSNTPAARTGKVLASPSVRQRARSLDIDLSEVAGSSGDAPVSHRDLDEFLLSRHQTGRTGQAGRSVTSVARPDVHAGQKLSGTDSNATETRGDTQISVVGLRRQIARKMQEAKRQIPHFSYVEEIDVTDLEKLRQTLNAERGAADGRLTLLPFIVRAMVMAVQRFPEINARYDSDNDVVTQFGAVHVGIATQTDNGLMVPVVRDAQRLDIWECASEIRRIASLTRHGKAQRSDLSGSTVTLSSLGPLGGIVSTPIINHPEVAIVGVNRIVERPVLDGGLLVSRKLMNLSSSFDHRVVDGMNAAQFIQEVKRLLESPVLLFVR